MLAQERSKTACLVALLLGASLLRGEIKVLKNFTLIDGSGRPPLAGAAMILHGLYDTLLKKELDAAALLVALASFGYLAYLIERNRKVGLRRQRRRPPWNMTPQRDERGERDQKLQ